MIRVDRIEGDLAVVELSSGAPGAPTVVELPLALLPEGTSEGSVLRLVLDSDATSDRRDRAAERIRRLAAQSSLPDEIEL